MQQIEVWPGDRIDWVARQAVEAAGFTGEDAVFTFNDTRVVVTPGQSIDDVVRGYQTSTGDDPDNHGAIVLTIDENPTTSDTGGDDGRRISDTSLC